MYWDPELAQIAQRHADQCRVNLLLLHLLLLLLLLLLNVTISIGILNTNMIVFTVQPRLLRL